MATKITREQIVTYLNVSPSGTASYALLGTGITDYTLSFNPQTTTEKWIINKNATTSLDSYQIAGSVSQKAYFGDEVYDFVNGLRRSASVGGDNETDIIDIDTYDATSNAYKAIKYACTVSVTSYGGEADVVIEYDINYNGDPIKGSVVITSGVPVFTADADA